MELGYDTPYAKFLETRTRELEKILHQLILAHGERKPIEAFIVRIEDWLGDDWCIDLSDEDAERLASIKGWNDADTPSRAIRSPPKR